MVSKHGLSDGIEPGSLRQCNESLYHRINWDGPFAPDGAGGGWLCDSPRVAVVEPKKAKKKPESRALKNGCLRRLSLDPCKGRDEEVSNRAAIRLDYVPGTS